MIRPQLQPGAGATPVCGVPAQVLAGLVMSAALLVLYAVNSVVQFGGGVDAFVNKWVYDNVTLAAFPLVPKVDLGFRAQVTAANTDAEIDSLCDAIEELADRGELRPAGAAPESQARAA